MSVRVLYRADGGHPIGMGHVQRALRVSACWVRTAPEVEVLLVTRNDSAVRNLVSSAAPPNVSVHYLESPRPSILPQLRFAEFAELAKSYSPEIMVVDMLDTDEAEMRSARSAARTLVALDDRGPGRLHADLICNFLVRDPDPAALDSDRTWLREGPQYASLGPEFVGVTRGRPEPESAKRVLVSVGGADAVGLAVKVAEDLVGVDSVAEVDFTLGPAFQMRAELESILARAPWRANLHVSLPSLLPLYATADLAIVAGGITMHEAACCGVPAIAVCQPIDHQLLVAGWLQEAGCMLNLGYGEGLASGAIASAVEEIASDRSRRQAMADAGPNVCDGRGSQRLAELKLERAGVAARRSETTA